MTLDTRPDPRIAALARALDASAGPPPATFAALLEQLGEAAFERLADLPKKDAR